MYPEESQNTNVLVQITYWIPTRPAHSLCLWGKKGKQQGAWGVRASIRSSLRAWLANWRTAAELEGFCLLQYQYQASEMGPKTHLPVYTLETAPPRLIFKIGTHNDKLLGTEANLSRTGKIGKKETDDSDQRERGEQARKSQKINYIFLTALWAYHVQTIKTPFKAYNSLVFTIFTKLCNQHHYPILEHFQYPKKKLTSITSNISVALSFPHLSIVNWP